MGGGRWERDVRDGKIYTAGATGRWGEGLGATVKRWDKARCYIGRTA